MWAYVWTAVVAVLVYVFMRVLASPKEKHGGSFDDFVAEDKSEARVKRVSKYATSYKDPGRQILVVFGTEYGFGEEVAKKFFDKLEETGANAQWQPRIVNLRDFKLLDLTKEHTMFVICSTAGDGIPPSDARSFFDWVAQQQHDTLQHVNYATLALGDTAYPHYARAGIQLDSHISRLGAKSLTNVIKVDREDWPVIDRWIDACITAIKPLSLPLVTDYLDLSGVGAQDTGYSRNKPFLAPMITKYSLTPDQPNEKDPKEVIHADIDLTGAGLTYVAGDALGIFPLNNPPEVDDLIQALAATTGKENVPWPSTYFAAKASSTENPTLHEALLRAYDLKTVKTDLVMALAERSKDTEQIELGKRLLKLGPSTSDNPDLAKYIADREVRDVLHDFSSAKFGYSDVLERLRPLQPRYYSISSSPVLNANVCSVTAAIVRYELQGKARTGVTTTFLADRRAVGQQCHVFISQNSHFRLPEDPSRPIIMIGPGTGIAPFRAFLQERIKTGATGNNVLYFGCRHRHIDFLYREELEQQEKDGHVKLRLAFSRDQAEKVYVQNLIGQDGPMLWALLEQTAHVYVCGDATHMAGDVHQALLRVLQSEGGLTPEQADEYMDKLENSHRYQRDVWV